MEKYLYEEDPQKIFEACKNNNYYKVVEFLNFKNINNFNESNYTLLMIASIHGYYEIVELLLTFGANANLSDNNGYTPLIFAIIHEKEDIALQLIPYSYVNKANHTNNTPLIWACYKKNYKIIRELINYHADINIYNNSNENALGITYSLSEFESFKLLLQYTDNPNIIINNEHILLYMCSQPYVLRRYILELFKHRNLNINYSNEFGNTSLIYACENQDIFLVQLLIDHNININWQNEYGTSPLLIACRNNDIKLAKLLLSYNANTELCDTFLNTPLIKSVKLKLYRMIQLLLDYNCIISTEALTIACEQKYDNIVKLFMEYNVNVPKFLLFKLKIKKFIYDYEYTKIIEILNN